MFCNVIIIRPFDQFFTYKFNKDQDVKEGSIVMVPFGKSKKEIGMVVNIFENIATSNQYKIKEIEKVYSSINLSKNIIKFIHWICEYTMTPIGLVLKLFIINEKLLISQ